MKEAEGLQIEYIPPQIEYDEAAEHKRLVRFVTLFAQVGFKEISLNSNSDILLLKN